jgi:hypothetical protein
VNWHYALHVLLAATNTIAVVWGWLHSKNAARAWETAKIVARSADQAGVILEPAIQAILAQANKPNSTTPGTVSGK